MAIIRDPSDAMVVFPKFEGRRFRENPELCFVLMPFGKPELNDIYNSLIKLVVEQNGLQCVRADEISSDNRIMEDIWRNMCEARVVICDLTGNNPNVYYELGICHVLGKRTILITQESSVPFDIHSWRCIIYSDRIGQSAEFTNKLDQTIKKVLAERDDPPEIENPETRAEILSKNEMHWEAAGIYLLLSRKTRAFGQRAGYFIGCGFGRQYETRRASAGF